MRVMVDSLSDEDKVKYARLLAEYVIVSRLNQPCELVKITEAGKQTCIKGSPEACMNWIWRNDPAPAYEGLKVGGAHYLWKEIQEPSLPGVPGPMIAAPISSYTEEYRE